MTISTERDVYLALEKFGTIETEPDWPDAFSLTDSAFDRLAQYAEIRPYLRNGFMCFKVGRWTIRRDTLTGTLLDKLWEEMNAKRLAADSE